MLEPYETKVLNTTITADLLGSLPLRVTAQGVSLEGFSLLQDSLTKQTEVVPRGFPVRLASSGIFKPGNLSGTLQFTLPPDTYNSGTLKVSAKVFTSPMDNILDAIASLIRDPYGCFEQTSSVTYPLVLVLRILMKFDSSD